MQIPPARRNLIATQAGTKICVTYKLRQIFLMVIRPLIMVLPQKRR